MDHLPQLETRPFIEVPCICNEDYDGLSFRNYPQRKGWDKDWLLKIGDYGGNTAEQTAAFLQTWLYFGLLSEVLGIKIIRWDFTRPGTAKGRRICTENLPRYLEDWKQRDSELSPRAKLQRQIKIDFCIDEVNSLLTHYRTLELQGLAIPILPEVMLSIMILGETLTRAKLRILECSETGNMAGWDHSGRRDWGLSDLLVQRMKEAGWCKSTIMMLHRDLGQVAGLYYASSFRPPVQRDHSQCSDLQCVKHQISENFSGNVHADICCICSPIAVDPKYFLETLVKGTHFPLIRFSIEKGSLECLPYDGKIIYVAISHVWSDGLGNPYGNSLPECQLYKLQNSVESLYPKDTKVYFWIDTLCVPVLPSEEMLRKMAISRMFAVYKSADKVLVLDRDLQSVSRPASYEETAMRITVSSWMRRLWTLQEGTLAKTVFFLFADGALNLDDLEENFYQADMLLHNGVAEGARKFYLSLRRPWMDGGEHLITTIWRAMQWRTTSNQADETIVIASLLGLDLAPLLEVSGHDRMEVLMCLLEVIPRGMLFLAGPHLKKPGLRWAPSSWLTKRIPDHPDPLSLAGPLAKVTVNGLLVTYPGLRLYPVGVAVGERFWVPTNKHLSIWYCITYIPEAGVPPWSIIAIHTYQRVSIIFCRPNPGEIPEIGVLAVNTGTDQNGYHCVQYKCRIWINLELDAQRIRGLKEKFLQYEMISAEILGPDYKWCVE